MSDPRHVIVFCVGGLLTPVEPFLRPLRQRGVHVTWIAENTTAEDFAGADAERLAATQFSSREELVDALDARHARLPVSAVVSFVEDFVPLAARLGARYGLNRLNSEQTAIATTDKHVMRQTLAAAGISVPGFLLVGDEIEALSAARSFGYPCVVKPVHSSGSRGVTVVESDDEVADAFAWAAHARSRSTTGDVLIESYAHGTEFSAELVVADEEIIFASFTEKHLIGGRYRDEIGHVHPTFLGAETTAIVRDVLVRTVRAVGARNSGCHVEFKVDGSRVNVIEIASRLGGAGIPELVRSSVGVDMIDLAYAAMLGEPIDPPPPVTTPSHYYGIWFVTATRSSVVRSDNVPRLAYGYPGVLRARVFRAPGERVVPEESGGERVAFVLGRHADKATLVSSLRAAAQTIDDAILEPDDGAKFTVGSPRHPLAGAGGLQ